VLLFELSPVADQGANSAALQMSDALGSIVMIGAGGVLFALLHQTQPGVVTFGAIFAAMAAAGLVAVWVATRVRPPRDSGSAPGAPPQTRHADSAAG
jgi:hypothetical protein